MGCIGWRRHDERTNAALACQTLSVERRRQQSRSKPGGEAAAPAGRADWPRLSRGATAPSCSCQLVRAAPAVIDSLHHLLLLVLRLRLRLRLARLAYF